MHEAELLSLHREKQHLLLLKLQHSSDQTKIFTLTKLLAQKYSPPCFLNRKNLVCQKSTTEKQKFNHSEHASSNAIFETSLWVIKTQEIRFLIQLKYCDSKSGNFWRASAFIGQEEENISTLPSIHAINETYYNTRTTAPLSEAV